MSTHRETELAEPVQEGEGCEASSNEQDVDFRNLRLAYGTHSASVLGWTMGEMAEKSMGGLVFSFRQDEGGEVEKEDEI